MKHIFIFFLLISSLFAQTPADVLKEIQKTDDILQNARPKIEESGSERAKDIFINAHSKQQLAWDLYNQGKYVEAAGATLLARKLCFTALEVVEHRFKANRVMERTREFLKYSAPKIRESGNEMAIEFLSQAIDGFERAQESFHNEIYRMAVRFSFQSASLIEKALRIIGREKLSPERIHLAISRTDRLIERAGPVVKESKNQMAINLLKQGIDLQGKAKKMLLEKKFAPAVKISLQSREIVVKALRMASGPLNPERVKKVLHGTRNLIKRTTSQISQCENEEAQNLFKRGMEHQKDAEISFEKTNYKEALTRTTVAYRLIRKAIEICGLEIKIEGWEYDPETGTFKSP